MMFKDFDKTRYANLEKVYNSWWNGTLDRPLIKIMVRDAFTPNREKPDVPLLSQANCHRFDYTPEQLVDRIDYELSTCDFLGDAFPMVNMWSFGPGVLAAFCGAELENSSGSVWFRTSPKSIEDIHIVYDGDNKWVKRIKAIYQAGIDRWGDSVVLGMPDLGGFQDVVANFLDSQEMLIALIEDGDELHRLQEEVYIAWMAAYQDLASVISGKSAGFSDWGGLYSRTSSYILQDDFAFMIGPDTFKEFGYPEIKKACQTLSHTIYHLDGVGNLNHLEQLLNLKELNAIQWVYGAGQPPAREWMDVYEKIYQAGKGIEVVGNLEDFYALSSKYGNRLFYQCTIDGKDGFAMKMSEQKDCIHSYHIFPYSEKQNVLKLLEKQK